MNPDRTSLGDSFAGIDVPTESAADSPSLSAAAAARLKGPHIEGFEIEQRIGEGGMGVVYAARQLHPIRRKVALKVVKPGMDSAAVVARFVAERQVLALLNHPNVAAVYDAGATDRGLPYFVMEYVANGEPITGFCDRNAYTVRQRIELFIQACEAIQHAHQKAIIHRDIKPSNLLVTTASSSDGDGAGAERPVVKVIDFGIAKATGQGVTEQTLNTALGQLVGTPQYMSPEQAEMNAHDIDTRSDIYSLGVVLYELLTGTTPLDDRAVGIQAHTSLLETLRALREDEVPPPSTRLAALRERATVIAARRGVDAARLGRLLQGDLTAIVLKALDKERARRYETANALAMDLRRYLRDEPVLATPTSALYRLRKFARRNTVALTAACVTLAALLAMLVALVTRNRSISIERSQANAALGLAASQSERAERNFWLAADAINQMTTRTAVARSDLPPGVRRQIAADAMRFYENLLREGTADPSVRYETAIGYRTIGGLQQGIGQPEHAQRSFRQSVAILEPLAAAAPSEARYRFQLALSRWALGQALDPSGKTPETLALEKAARDELETLSAQAPGRAEYHLELAGIYIAQNRGTRYAGREEEAKTYLRRAADLLESAAGGAPMTEASSHRGLAISRGYVRQEIGHKERELALTWREVGQPEEAERLYRRAAATFERNRHEDPAAADHFVADCHRLVGVLLMQRNLLKESERELKLAVEMHERRAAQPADLRLTPDHLEPEWAAAYFDLAVLLIKMHRRDGATAALRRGLEIDPSDHERWYDAAGLFLWSGDEDGYRTACRELIDRFGSRAADGPVLAERLAKVCCLSPLTAGDLRRVEKLADRAVNGTQRAPEYPWFMLAKALADYRLGRYASAAEWIGRLAPKADGWSMEGSAYSILAMAQQRLGRSADAKRSLATARAILASNTNHPSRQNNWRDWLHAEILAREAAKVVGTD